MTDGFSTYVVPIFAFCAGLGFASAWYESDIAEMEKAQAVALKEAQTAHADKLAKATDTINLAQAEYNDLRAELDRARARLRHADRSGSAEGDSSDALSRRVTELEGLVRKLVDSGSECGRLYQRSAANHDALATLSKEK